MQPLADERHCSPESKARILALSSLRYQNLSAISLLGLYRLFTRGSSPRSRQVVNVQQQSDPNDSHCSVCFYISTQITNKSLPYNPSSLLLPQQADIPPAPAQEGVPLVLQQVVLQ